MFDPVMLDEQSFRHLEQSYNRERQRPNRSATATTRFHGTEATSAAVVQIYTGATAGDLLSPTSGVFAGRVRYLKTNSWTSGLAVWIGYIDWESDSGAVVGEEQRSFVGFRAGVYTVSSVTRPLYHVQAGEMSFIGKPDSGIAKGSSGTVSLWHRSTEADSTINLTAKALGAAVTSGLWVSVSRVRGGQIYAAPWEC